MLVLTRKIGQRLVLDDNTVIEVLTIRGNSIQLGITGPARVHREELLQRGEDHTAQQHDTIKQAAFPLGMPESTWAETES